MLYLIKIVYNPVYRDNFYNPKERLKGYILNCFLILTLIIKGDFLADILQRWIIH